ncbi:MAG TPA: hypothetical protein VHM00_00130 [Caldimonas sp.]|jgi:hypothetical protein|nr:hypothetical protein [Caldimonas sp.]HEX2539471.1 hypothetical protein [Caldimonas sp.]
MKIGRLTLAIAIAGLAAQLFMKKRDDGRWAQPDFVDTEHSGYADAGESAAAGTEMTPAGDMPADVTAATAAAAGADSPNPAERMQAAAPTRLAEAIEGTSDDLFDSNSQDGPFPKTPGLPDLTRGA